MSYKRSICVVTGTRAEYGLLKGIMSRIDASCHLSLKLIVTGAHLSEKFGMTWEEINDDGFVIDYKIELNLESDTPMAICHSMGCVLTKMATIFNEMKPDLLLLLGDRYEIMGASIAALNARIPIAHIHGGETTEGAVDEAFRHCITKMSHIHFAATEDYRERIIQLGERPENVFNVGSPGVDMIRGLTLMSKNELELSLGLSFFKKNLLITYHPVTLEENTAEHQCQALINALDDLKETRLIFTLPNTDAGNDQIFRLMNNYVDNNLHKASIFNSMGQLRYLSSLQYVDAVVGNSSSGLIEAPSFKIGTINIGDRQKGRITADSVISVKADYYSIKQSIETLYSENFQNSLITVENPYSQVGTIDKIVNILESLSLTHIIKKRFHDLRN